MTAPAPFSGVNDLATAWGTLDGSPAGTFRSTISGNFGKIRTEVIGLHNRLLSVEGALGVGSATRGGRVSLNSHFQVKRSGVAFFAVNTPLATRVTQNRNAFVPLGYTAGRLNPGGAAHYNYIHLAAAGWMGALQALDDEIGVPLSADAQMGVQLRFKSPTGGYFNTMQPGVGAGYLIGAAGDLPGVYQVLTRHVPVERLRGQALSLRLRYAHAAAIPTGCAYNLFISWSDGARRYDAYSPALSQATTPSDVLFSTASVTSVFPGGLIPQTATSVEIGIVLGTHSGAFSDDIWDVHHLIAEVGQPGADVAPDPYATDWTGAAMFYSQGLGPDLTGTDQEGASLHPLIAAGAAQPTMAQAPFFQARYPWPLCMPWRKAAAALVPQARVLEVVGACADSAGFNPSMGGPNETFVITVAVGAAAIVAGTAWGERGLVASLERSVAVTPSTNLSVLLSNVNMPCLRWGGEVFCVLSPIGY